MDCSTQGFPVHHQLPELAQTHVHRVGDIIQPTQNLSSMTPPAFGLSQQQGLFQWVSSLHQVANVLELHLLNWTGLSTPQNMWVLFFFLPFWILFLRSRKVHPHKIPMHKFSLNEDQSFHSIEIWIHSNFPKINKQFKYCFIIPFSRVFYFTITLWYFSLLHSTPVLKFQSSCLIFSLIHIHHYAELSLHCILFPFHIHRISKYLFILHIHCNKVGICITYFTLMFI